MAGTIEQTARDVVQATYLRLEAAHIGKQVARLTDGERASILDRWRNEIAHDVGRIVMMVQQARTQGVEHLRDAMHAVPNVDHEMLEEAAEFAQAQAALAAARPPPAEEEAADDE